MWFRHQWKGERQRGIPAGGAFIRGAFYASDTVFSDIQQMSSRREVNSCFPASKALSSRGHIYLLPSLNRPRRVQIAGGQSSRSALPQKPEISLLVGQRAISPNASIGDLQPNVRTYFCMKLPSPIDSRPRNSFDPNFFKEDEPESGRIPNARLPTPISQLELINRQVGTRAGQMPQINKLIKR